MVDCQQSLYDVENFRVRGPTCVCVWGGGLRFIAACMRGPGVESN